VAFLEPHRLLLFVYIQHVFQYFFLAFGVFLCPFDELSSGEANLTVPEQHDDAATGFSKKLA
jgi:hypothetical protein